MNESFDDAALQWNRSPVSTSSGYNFLENLNLRMPKIIQTLRCVEYEYNDVPYHNNLHVTDVLQTLHSVLIHAPLQFQDSNTNKPKIKSKENASNSETENLASFPEFPFIQNVTSIDLYSILLSAVIHDVFHEGLNNIYYQNQPSSFEKHLSKKSTHGELYHETIQSLKLEHFHDLLGRRLLREHGAFGGMSDEQVAQAETMISNAVLATDMSMHFDVLKRLENELDRYDTDDTTICVQDGGCECGDGTSSIYNITSFFSYLLHAADISAPAKSSSLSSQWIPRVLSEFFLQGDLEKDEGLPVSPLCDREEMTYPTNYNAAMSQVQFIEKIVGPTYKLLERVIPWTSEEVYQLMEANLELMQQWALIERG